MLAFQNIEYFVLRLFSCVCGIPAEIGVPGRDSAAARHRDSLNLHGQRGVSQGAYLERLGCHGEATPPAGVSGYENPRTGNRFTLAPNTA